MKVIFLDVDGTINNSTTKARCGIYIGIDGALVKRLKEIVDATDAAIILSSDWRLPSKDDEETDHMKYLRNKLGKQHLRPVGMTPNIKRDQRGHEIQKWLENNNDIVEQWVVLDDEVFEDFEECGIMPHLVQTTFYSENGGLQEEHVQQAIKILNGEIS